MYLPRKRKRNSIKARTWVASLATLACVGCANLGVKPWQRDVLAKPSMQLVADPLEAASTIIFILVKKPPRADVASVAVAAVATKPTVEFGKPLQLQIEIFSLE